MNNPYLTRNICIGLIDGLIIPLALATGLSAAIDSSQTIIIACLIASFAGACTMSIGGFIEARRYEPKRPPFIAALTIGVSYLAGGLIVSAPYVVVNDTMIALKWSAVISFTILLAAGYIETHLHGARGWKGGLRVLLTGALAATAAFLVARLFT